LSLRSPSIAIDAPPNVGTSYILGYAEMALDAVPAGSNLQRYLGNVMAAANRAKDLVDQILAFTQARKP
ncbi:MAG: hypothetical protein ACREXY_03370, partial [Gammaproteobacteria bacterium]